MRFKFDENAAPRWRSVLEDEGHIVSTVAEQHMRGASDDVVARTCQDHGMCLITMDLGFAQIIAYPPQQYPGIIVLRHSAPTLAGMNQLVRQLATALRERSPKGNLWIVEPGRIRVHASREDRVS